MPDTTKNAANQDARQAVFTAQEAPDSARLVLIIVTGTTAANSASSNI